jgi:regulation of enolase protein 1 (concanavalin A-like superfamily)
MLWLQTMPAPAAEPRPSENRADQDTVAAGGKVLFEDNFNGRLKPGWSWIRENPDGWRVTEKGLQLRVEPGNMWGPANNAKNVLVRPAPNPVEHGVETSVTVTNRPTEQWEQVNLVWYYDDSNMVKLGQEQVDGQLSIVMGREQNDRARTIAIIPIEAHTVEVRFLVRNDQLRGEFRTPDSDVWQEAGECDLPVKGEPKISIQAYQGPADAERWAEIRDFRIRRLAD